MKYNRDDDLKELQNYIQTGIHFSLSAVQRITSWGYNRSRSVVFHGIEKGMVIQNKQDDIPYYVFT